MKRTLRSRWLAAALLPLGLIATSAGFAQSAFRLQEARIDDIHAAMKSGQLTCRRLVQAYLDRIEAYDKRGPALNALQHVNARALEEADRLDAAFKSGGVSGLLHCIPVLVKDQVETSDMPTTYGSAAFARFMSQRDATIVERMRKAGAVILGKTTMGEFASRYIGSASGIIRNAYDPSRNASGSSGGTGSAIAANFAAVGIGEDTGGSIRGPAAVSSLVGLRPTVPLVSRFGMMPAVPVNDTLGPITRTVRDAAILLDVIAGYDPNDPVTAAAAGQVPKSYTAALNRDALKGARIGVLRDPLDAKTDAKSEDYGKVKMVVDRAIADLRRLGAEVIDPVTIPKLREMVVAAYTRNQFETEPAINAYLASHKNAPVKTLQEIVITGKVTPWRTTQLLANIGKTTNDPGYLQVLKAREAVKEAVFTLMADQRLDAILYATFDHQTTPIAADVLTNPATKDAYGLGSNRNLSPAVGFPAIAVPAGFTSDALPVGIELMARPFAEPLLFGLAYAYEQGTMNRKPPSTTPPLPGEM
jgi:amidase